MRVLAYVLLRLTFRRTALAVIASVVLLALVQTTNVLTSAAPTWIAALYQVVVVTAVMIMVVRYGLLVSSVVTLVDDMLETIPLTLSLVALDGDHVEPDDGAGHRPRLFRLLRRARRAASLRDFADKVKT